MLLWSALLQQGVAQAASSSLTLSLSKHTSELGKPVYLLLGTSLATPALTSINLKDLRKHFVIDNIESIDAQEHTIKQTVRLRLYPRQSGEKLIPELAFYGGKTKPVKIRITPPIDQKNNSTINIKMDAIQRHVWRKEAVQVYMDIETASEIVALRQETETVNNIHISTLPVSHQTVAGNNNTWTRHRVGWLIYPNTNGIHNVQLPPVSYIRDGVTTHRFYPALIKLDTKNLPTYLPDTTPVGRVNIEVDTPNEALLIKRNLYYLSVKLGVDYYSPIYRSILSRQFRSNKNIRFYPTEETGKTVEPINHKTAINYRIPFTIETAGLLQFPQLKIQYFDPQTGKISTKHFNNKRLFVVTQWLVIVLYLVGIGVLTWIAGRIIKITRSSMRRHYVYFQALQQLYNPESVDDLKISLDIMSQAESWPDNSTIKQRLARWNAVQPELSEVTEKIGPLQELIYGKCEGNINTIQDSLIMLCYRRQPLLRLYGYLKDT